MDRDRVIEAATGVLAAILFVLSLFGTYVSLRDGSGVVTALLGVYLTGLLLAAVFRDSMQTRGWRVAFFAGVAAWGGYEYLAGDGSVFSLLFAAIGVAMVVASALDTR